MSARTIVLLRLLGSLRAEPTLAELFASLERERLREVGVLVWCAREAQA